MLVILSAMGGLLESDPRDIYLAKPGCIYRVPVFDLSFNFWKQPSGELPPVQHATFEHMGKYRMVGDRRAFIFELVEYPERIK